MTTVRYAVYWAPETDHPLWSAGCAWLGRDALAAEVGPAPPGRSEPWRYGFHATLKAPMRLAEGQGLPDLRRALDALAARHAPFALPPLAVGTLGGFVALRLVQEPPALRALADDAVTRLDPLRAALPAAEAARRAQGLDDEQRALLQRWGYPHVFNRWRFHLTLTDPLPDAARRDAACVAAQRHFAAALAAPALLASVCLFEEPAPRAPLRLVHRCPLRG